MERPQVKTQALITTAKAMVAEGKGLLAMDESNPTCNKRRTWPVTPERK